MEALLSLSSASSSNLSLLPTKRSIPFQKPIFSFPSKHPKSNSFQICRNKNQFKVFSVATTPSPSSTTSKEPTVPPSTISTTPKQPAVPDLQLQQGNEKFDWYSNWYPIAPICDLDKRVPHGKTVMGLDVVAWWDRAAEKWQVFDDRCPHRLAPLSEGRIDQWGRLQCVYHGWCFDGAGQCKHIPQAPPEGPPVQTFKKACTPAYPTFVQNNILWFWPRAEPQYKDIAMTKKPPYIPELDDPSFTNSFATREMPYGFQVLVENIMDPAHITYAHYGVLHPPKDPKKPPRDREGGIPLENKVEKMDKDGFLATNLTYGNGKFFAPGVFYTFPEGAPSDEFTSSKSIEKESSANSVQRKRMALLVFFCIPVSPGRSRLITNFPRNFSNWIDRITPRWVLHVQENLVVDGDLYLLHRAERKMAKADPSDWLKACFLPTKADALVVGYRKWLKKYSDGQIGWSSDIDRALPPPPPREKLMDRYTSHVKNCISCQKAEKGLQALQISLQVISVASIGIVAALRQNMMPMVARSVVVSMALAFFLASKWLSKFIYKTFYYHDYYHGLI